MKKINTGKIVKEVLIETAQLREEILESAALEEDEEVYNMLLELIWIAWTYICAIFKVEYINNISAEDIAYKEDDKDLRERLRLIWKIYAISEDLGFLWNCLELIMKSEIVHAINLLGAAMLKKYPEKYTGIYRVEISEGTCSICSGFNGEVFDIDEIEHPPFHPGCMCSIDIIEEDIDTEEVEVELDRDDILEGM